MVYETKGYRFDSCRAYKIKPCKTSTYKALYILNTHHYHKCNRDTYCHPPSLSYNYLVNKTIPSSPLPLAKDSLKMLLIIEWITLAIATGLLTRKLSRNIRICTSIIIATLLIALINITYLATANPNPTIDYLNKYNELLKPSRYNEADNAWPIYQKAIQHFQPMNDEVSSIYYSHDTHFSPEQLSTLEKWVTVNTSSLELLTKASAMPYCYIKYQYSQNDNMTYLNIFPPHEIKDFTSLIFIDSIIHSYNKQYDKIFTNFDTIIKISNQIYNPQAALISQIIANSMQKNAIQSLSITASNSDTPKETLLQIQNKIKKIDKTFFEINFSKGEKYYIYDAIQKSYLTTRNRKGKLAWKSTLLDDDFSSKFSKIKECLFGNIEKQVYHQIEKLEALYNSLKDQKLRPWQVEESNIAQQMQAGKYNDFPLADLGRLLTRAYTIPALTKVQYHCLTTAIAVKLYYLDHLQLPETLQEIANSDYIDTIPDDPFNNGKIAYKITDIGFIVYSYGHNYIDNNGDEEEDLTLEVYLP